MALGQFAYSATRERVHEPAVSLQSVAKNYRVTYDSDNSGTFMVNAKEGVLDFIPHPNGFHYINEASIKYQSKTAINKSAVIKHSQKDSEGETTMLVKTVQHNFEGYQAGSGKRYN